MKKTAAVATILLALALAGVAYASRYSGTVRVLNSAATKLPRYPWTTASPATSHGWEVVNTGPNTIWCQLGSNGNDADGGPPVWPDAGSAVGLGQGTPLTTGQHWSGQGDQPIWCIAASADQADGGGTTVNEAP